MGVLVHSSDSDEWLLPGLCAMGFTRFTFAWPDQHVRPRRANNVA